MPIINGLLVLAVAFFLGIFLLFPLKKLSLKYKFLLTQGIPSIGGFSLAPAFLLAGSCAIYFSGAASKETFGLILASLLMLIFGAVDDWRELSITFKFLLQIICVFVLVIFGVKTQIVYIGSLANILITAIWVLAITNAFNHLDIMDGVAGFSALIVSVVFLLISFLNADPKSALFSLALIGGILSFLPYNLPAARVYLGNAGSHFLGFVLSAIALMISYAPMERKFALASPLLILGFPIYDTCFLVFIRLLKKKIPFKKSNDHLALRYLAMGYSKKKTLACVVCLNIFFVCAGLITYKAPNWLAILTVAVVVFVGLGLAKNLARVKIA